MAVYLDYNATAPLREVARTAMLRAYDAPGNPSSVHGAGRKARAMVEEAREVLAGSVGAARSDVVFTAGGTEANNLGLLGLAKANGCSALFISAIEHPCIRDAAANAALPIRIIPVTKDGVIDLEALQSSLQDADSDMRPLLALMAVNNETGVIQPVAEAASLMHEADGFIHVDAVQGFGKIPISLAALGVDSLAVSAHKIGGPMGVGALALACDAKISPRHYGGGQEKGHRGGTENVAGIVGFAAAAKAALSDLVAHNRIEAQRDHLQKSMLDHAPDAVVVGANAPRVSNTLCIATPGFASDTQVMVMDLAGFAISAGSACASGKVKSTSILTAMHLPEKLLGCAIRISLGSSTTHDEIDAFAKAWGSAFAQTGQQLDQKQEA